MKRKIAILAALLYAALSANAQIKVEAPSLVASTEQFNVTFSLSEKPSSFDWEPGESFKLVWGPQKGSSTSISSVNGQVSKTSQYTFTYILLPKSNGVFNLPAAHAVVDGRDVYSRSPKIEVVSNGGGSQPSTLNQGSSAGGNSSAGNSGGNTVVSDKSSPDIFLRFELARRSVVLGEPLKASLKLYVRGNLSGLEDAKLPSFDGFWSQEIEAPQNLSFVRENVGGNIYNATLLRSWMLIPQKTGAIEIEPAELICLLQQRVSTGNPIFDSFYDDYQTIRKRVTTPALTVNVSSLPAGAPASFTGAVGSFSIDAVLSPDSLKMHDAATLTLTVTGRGNVALIGAPSVKFPPDSEVYDVKTSDNMDSSTGRTSGTRTFEYPFIPRSSGEFAIAPVEFTYYDISARKYVTLATPEIKYSVARSENADYMPADGIAIPSQNRKDVKNLSEDIHYISVKIPKLSREGEFVVGTPLYLIMVFLIFALGTAFYLVSMKIRRDNSDQTLVKTRTASKLAKKRLASANEYLKKNLYSVYYEELHKALLGYAADKLSIPSADLSKDSISASLADNGLPEALIADFVGLLDACEFARYAPDGGNEAMQESYDKAVAVISSIDATMKKKSKSVSVTATLLFILMSLPLTLKGEDVATLPIAEPNDTVSVENLFDAGVKAYSEQNYYLASKSFKAIEDRGYMSPELYTNLADAYYKQGMVALSVLYYERALKLNPSFKDAKYNLRIANQSVRDKIEPVPEFFLKTFSRNVCYSLSSNAWAWISVTLFALMVVMFVMFLLSSGTAAKRTGFFVSIIALILAIVCLVNASWQKNDYENRNSAIIMSPVCSVKSSPSDMSGDDLFVLHEGTKVTMLDEVGAWTKVILSDGREGWIQTGNIMVI